MEQIVVVPTSVYNKGLINESVTKLELPKYQALQKPTYQIVLLKRRITRNYFPKQTL